VNWVVVNLVEFELGELVVGWLNLVEFEFEFGGWLVG
jgi:hypothetical protein